MLQEVMHSHSISVVEEAVLEPNHQGAHTPQTPAGMDTPGTRLPTSHLQATDSAVDTLVMPESALETPEHTHCFNPPTFSTHTPFI